MVFLWGHLIKAVFPFWNWTQRVIDRIFEWKLSQILMNWRNTIFICQFFDIEAIFNQALDGKIPSGPFFI